jgi:hypothetical protein
MSGEKQDGGQKTTRVLSSRKIFVLRKITVVPIEVFLKY